MTSNLIAASKKNGKDKQPEEEDDVGEGEDEEDGEEIDTSALHPTIQIALSALKTCAHCKNSLEGINQTHASFHTATGTLCHIPCMPEYIRALDEKAVMLLRDEDDRKVTDLVCAAHELVHVQQLKGCELTFPFSGIHESYVLHNASKALLDNSRLLSKYMGPTHIWAPSPEAYETGHIAYRVTWPELAVTGERVMSLITSTVKRVRDSKSDIRWSELSGVHVDHRGRVYMYLRFMGSVSSAISLANASIAVEQKQTLLRLETVTFQPVLARARVHADVPSKTICVDCQTPLDRSEPVFVFALESLFMVKSPVIGTAYPFATNEPAPDWHRLTTGPASCTPSSGSAGSACAPAKK